MRIVFNFRPTVESAQAEGSASLPPGFTHHRIDDHIAESLQDDLIRAGNGPWFEEQWGGIAPFLSGGFGFAILHDGNVVSNCRSYSVRDGVAAIQVSTRAKYRQRGFAIAVCRAFIGHCIARGLLPEYSCVQENHASAALAVKLGFAPIGTKEDDEEASAAGSYFADCSVETSRLA